MLTAAVESEKAGRKSSFLVLRAIAVWFSLWLLAGIGLAQDRNSSGFLAFTTQPEAEVETGVRAFPRIDLGGGSRLEYVGAFSAEGRYKNLSKVARFAEAMTANSVPGETTAQASPEVRLRAPWGPLHSPERVIDDLDPTTHLVEIARPQPLLGLEDVREAVTRLVFGPDEVMVSPYGVTTDSKQRVIISDPVAHSVHVLQYKGKGSFRIVGGEDHRLHSPTGVAVDSADNIYVSDTERGMVLVYDPQGRFLRYIGNVKGENDYQGPTGIAIDRAAGRIYLLDTPRHLLFMLDLEGNVLGRYGRRGGGTGPGEFAYPTAVAVYKDEVIVLDRVGTRIQILDLEGKFRKQFDISPHQGLSVRLAGGMCVDSEGNIYVSDTVRRTVRVYNHEGKLLRVLGQPGNRPGEFQSPAGLWADAQDRVYVADSNRLRLQIFQFSRPK